jgi:hypothetical protein
VHPRMRGSACLNWIKKRRGIKFVTVELLKVLALFVGKEHSSLVSI